MRYRLTEGMKKTGDRKRNGQIRSEDMYVPAGFGTYLYLK